MQNQSLKSALIFIFFLCLAGCESSSGGGGESDRDNDGVVDSLDAFPDDPNETLDTDGDLLGNNADPNDDNDPDLDEQDAFPLDPTEWDDIDEDLIGDNKDLDLQSTNPQSIKLERLVETGRATKFTGPLSGEVFLDGIGLRVANVGDVNGDTFEDLAVAYSLYEDQDIPGAGIVYLFFGKQVADGERPWPANIDLENIDDDISYITFRANIVSGKFSALGSSIAGLGDVNGDNIDDFVVGATVYSPSPDVLQLGQAHLVFGRNSWVADAGDDRAISYEELTTQYALSYTGEQVLGHLGYAVAAVGDVNGDQVNDFLISERGYDTDIENTREDKHGRVHLIFGGEHLQPPTVENPGVVNIDDVPANERVVINGFEDSKRVGETLLGLGNFDNDPAELSDFAIGAPASSQSDVYILFGRTNWPESLYLDDLGAGFSFESDGNISRAMAAGDLTGDNIPDLVLSAPLVETELEGDGEVYILKGGVDNWPKQFNTENFSEFFGYTITSSDTLYLGFGVSVLPHVNGNQLIIDGPAFTEISQAFKILGRTDWSNLVFNKETDPEGVERFISDDLNDEIGRWIYGVGDYNQDGFNEFVIGQRIVNPGENTPNSEVYLVYGYKDLYATKN